MHIQEQHPHQEKMTSAWRRREASAAPANTSKSSDRLRTYEICYLTADERLICKMVVMCRSATCAKVMAHAMKLPHYKHIEVWRGETRIYSRPLRYQSIVR